jgi:hypothetical protein
MWETRGLAFEGVCVRPFKVCSPSKGGNCTLFLVVSISRLRVDLDQLEDEATSGKICRPFLAVLIKQLYFE